MSTITKTALSLKPNQIIHHSGRDTYYMVLGDVSIKAENGWVPGISYFPVTKQESGFRYLMSDITSSTYVRPVSMFGDKWSVIEEPSVCSRLALS